MTEEKVTQGGGESPNPPKKEIVDPSEQKPQPQNEQGNSADLEKLKALLDEMNGKLERYKEQVKGSSEEALRLKEENEKLQTKVGELQKGGTAGTQGSFQEIMEKDGLEAAILHAVKGELASLSQRVETFESNEAEKLFENFKSTHKELDDSEVLAKFDRELSKLKNVYDNVDEAMEKAYLLAIDGRTAPIQSPEVEDPQKKANDDKVVKNVAGAEEDKRSSKPVQNATELQTRINDLQYEAMTLQHSGRVRQAAELLTKVEELKAQLGEKV